MGSFPRRTWAPDYPIRLEARCVPGGLASSPRSGAGPTIARRFLAERAPSIAADDEAVAWYASYFVRGASPSAVVQLGQMNAEIDVRHVLPTVHVPALVLHRENEYLADASRYLGERIPGARVVALPGADHLPWEGPQEDVLGEIERFVAGLDAVPLRDRVLATVLVVRAEGTEGACDVVREDVARFRGRELALEGDTLVATFDGPARAIRCAQTLSSRAREFGHLARAGIHTGECDVIDGMLTGIPLGVARQLVDLAEPGEAVASSTVRDLVAGSGLEFVPRPSSGGLAAEDMRLFTVSSSG